MSGLNEELVRNALRTVMDPELGASLVDLGMVREIGIDGGQVTVNLVLTAPGCPLAGWIVMNVKRAVGRLPGVKDVEVRLLDEPWQPPENSDWQSWVNGATGRQGW